MILLTDEEIRGVNGDTRGPDQRERNIAKAQLKKVVEWLDTFEFYDDFGGESGSMFRDTLKQALLEETQ